MSYYFLFLTNGEVCGFVFSLFLNLLKFLWPVYTHSLPYSQKHSEATNAQSIPKAFFFYIYCMQWNRYSTFLEAKFKVSESRMEYLTGDLCHCMRLILILILFAFNISGIILNPCETESLNSVLPSADSSFRNH